MFVISDHVSPYVHVSNSSITQAHVAFVHVTVIPSNPISACMDGDWHLCAHAHVEQHVCACAVAKIENMKTTHID